MNPHMHSDRHISTFALATSPHPDGFVSAVSRAVYSAADLSACSSDLDTPIQAPGNADSSLRQSGNLSSETPSGKSHAPGPFQKSTHLPTPQSPGNMASYLLTKTPSSSQNFPPDLDPATLPTEFPSYMSSSPPSFRIHSIPTPESSPLVARSRSNGPHLLAQRVRTNGNDDDGPANRNRRDSLHSRASTPSWHPPTRPITPVLPSRPITPLRRGPTEPLSPTSCRLHDFHSNDVAANPSPHRVQDEPGGEAARIGAQLVESHLASQAAELHRPDYFKRMRRCPPSGGACTGGASDASSLTSELGNQDASLLWSSAHVGVIQSPAKGKRIALFQETSEESFEESLMAGGYGPYAGLDLISDVTLSSIASQRSDRSWKLDEHAEVPNQLGDATGEEGLRPPLVLTEEEKRKKSRLAAFLDPPRVTSATQLFPVEIEGRGRVLMKVEPSEPQSPPKPTPKAKRSRKRRKASADMKQDVDKDSTTAPEDGALDGPNWPDMEFPWRSRLTAQDGLSSAEREERLRYIESFLDRDSDEDDVEEGYSPPGPRALGLGGPSRSPRLSRGKTYPHLSHSKDRKRGTTTLSDISADPADARTALLSKKSIRAVRLRLLRRRDIDHHGESDDDQVLCICRGRDDGRPLVQCDACRTWYHLECIGILSTSELGREEDPWFCANCAEVKTPPPVVALLEPTLVAVGDDEQHGVGGQGSTHVEGYDPPFLNAGLNPSPVTPWTRSLRPPTTPPRIQYAPHDEPPSSSSQGEPRTPHFNTASAFGDMVRVYGMAPGRSLEGSSSTVIDESPFDPTSTPSRGIRFGLPFTTPKDGRWGSSPWPGARGSASGYELFHTPKHAGEEDGGGSLKAGQPLLYHGRVGEVSEGGPSGVPGLHRTTGSNNVTPIERDMLSGLKRMQVLESPLGGKRSRRTIDS